MSRPGTGKTPDEKAFREILKDYRIKNGYSQSKLARILEMDQSALNKFESGKMTFSVKRMIDIAEKLDLKNKIINPINFTEFKKIAVKILRIPVLDDYLQTEEELKVIEQKANKYLFFDISFFQDGSFYAVENTENLEGIEKGEYLIVNIEDKEIKEFDTALIKKENRFLVRKLTGNKFMGSKEYPDLTAKGVSIIGKVIMAVKIRKL